MTTNPFDNEAFRDEFKSTIAASLKPLTDTLAEHDALLKEHQDAITRGKTILGVIVFAWTGFLTGVEWLIHRR